MSIKVGANSAMNPYKYGLFKDGYHVYNPIVYTFSGTESVDTLHYPYGVIDNPNIIYDIDFQSTAKDCVATDITFIPLTGTSENAYGTAGIQYFTYASKFIAIDSNSCIMQQYATTSFNSNTQTTETTRSVNFCPRDMAIEKMSVFSKPVSNFYLCYDNENDADEFLFIWNFSDAGGSSALILLKTYILLESNIEIPENITIKIKQIDNNSNARTTWSNYTYYDLQETKRKNFIANNKYYTMIEAKYTSFLSNDLFYHLTSPYIALTYPAGFVFNDYDYVKVINYHYRVQFLRYSKSSGGPY